MIEKYTGLSADHFNIITNRYKEFQDSCNDMTKEPVKVFNPLGKKSLEELILIREVSKDLQMKKEEDVKKAAQMAQEQQKPEETPTEEEKKSEVEK